MFNFSDAHPCFAYWLCFLYLIIYLFILIILFSLFISFHQSHFDNIKIIILILLCLLLCLLKNISLFLELQWREENEHYFFKEKPNFNFIFGEKHLFP